MARTTNITLDGVMYTVRAFNIDQIERAVSAFDSKTKATVPLAVLRIAMERAEPQVALADLEPKMEEITAAFQTIMELAGIQTERKAANGADGPLAVAPN